MIAWWNNMDIVGQIYALIAIPATLVLLIQTIMVLFGGEGDLDDADDLEVGTDGNGLALFSLRGLMAMAAVGGWSGLVMYEAGINLAITILLSCAFGFMALVGIAYIVKLSSKLQSSGNLDLGYAIGKVGTVYIPIPPAMTGSGKVNLTVQEHFVEVNAMTTSNRKLATGESVRIVSTDETGLLVVEPVGQGKEK